MKKNSKRFFQTCIWIIVQTVQLKNANLTGGLRANTLTRMFFSMFLQILPPLKQPPANITYKRFLRRVCRHVISQYTISPETLITNLTNVLLIFVYRTVRLQILLKSKHFATNFAIKNLAVLSQVRVQVLLGHQFLLADVTTELVDVQVGHLFVFVKSVITGIKFAADVAHDLRLAVRGQVKFQVPLDLEQFAAVLARERILSRVFSDVMCFEIVFDSRAVGANSAGVVGGVLVSQKVQIQIALVLETLVAIIAVERSARAVLAFHVTSDFVLLIERLFAEFAAIIVDPHRFCFHIFPIFGPKS